MFKTIHSWRRWYFSLIVFTFFQWQWPVQSPASGFPVTIDSCGEKTIYRQAPERAVANDINITEIMLRLGLEERMAGTSGVEGMRHPVLPSLEAAYRKVPRLSARYPSMEVLLGADPDFVFAGWNYGFREGGVTPAKLKKMGIDSYVLSESCIRIMKLASVTMEDTYRDIVNIGKIFGIEEKSQKLVKAFQHKVKSVERARRQEKKVRVFVYDSGDDMAFTSGSFGMPNTLIRLAGGEHIFNDLDQNWTTVSWEQIVSRNPQVIVVVDYGSPDAEAKKNFLLNHYALQEVEAIRNQRFVVLPYAAATPGIRNADAIVELAKAFYPELF